MTYRVTGRTADNLEILTCLSTVVGFRNRQLRPRWSAGDGKIDANDQPRSKEDPEPVRQSRKSKERRL